MSSGRFSVITSLSLAWCTWDGGLQFEEQLQEVFDYILVGTPELTPPTSAVSHGEMASEAVHNAVADSFCCSEGINPSC